MAQRAVPVPLTPVCAGSGARPVPTGQGPAPTAAGWRLAIPLETSTLLWAA